jgi:hypothetical protein
VISRRRCDRKRAQEREQRRGDVRRSFASYCALRIALSSFALCLFVISPAFASPMMASRVERRTTIYENGDEVLVSCDRNDDCTLVARVSGRRFSVTSKTLSGSELLPDGFELYSGGGTNGAELFSVVVGIVCPESNRDIRCYASLQFQHGKVTSVQKYVEVIKAEKWP